MEPSQETGEMINAVHPMNAMETDDTLAQALPDAAPGASSSSAVRVRQPPAFLRKVYDIVSDPETDSIVSWNSSGTSLIVWDPHKFAAEVLGKFFKHRNISSFVCQLNSYGFRKIDWERMEFQNEWFQKGKQPWLNRIKRRNQGSRNVLVLSEKRVNVEALIQEHEALKTEMMKLVRKQEALEKELASLEKRAQGTLSKRQKTLKYILQEAFRTNGETRIESSAKNEEFISSDHKKADYAMLEKLLMDDDGDDPNWDDFSEEEIANLQTDLAISLDDLMAGPADWAEFAKHLQDEPRNL